MWAIRFLILVAFALSPACGDDEGEPSNSNGQTARFARFIFNCDLQGQVGVLTMDVEAISTTGVTWGPGPNPDITGVIGLGGVTYHTAGELRSSVAHYVFTGRDQFADFTESATFERFRVQWVPDGDDMIMIVNPFGPGPTQHVCTLTSSEFL